MLDPGGSAGSAPEGRVASAGGQLAAMLLYLSLFLLLLVFFAVLASLTRLEAVRTTAALGSLESAFRGTVSGRALAPAPGPLASTLAEELGALARNELPLVQITVEQSGDSVRLTLAVGEIFQFRRAELRTDRARLLDAIARLTLSGGEASERDFDFVIDGGGQDESARELALARLSALTRAFVGRGVPAERAAALLDDAASGSVHFRFRARGDNRP